MMTAMYQPIWIATIGNSRKGIIRFVESMPRILKRTGAIASTLVVERQTLVEDRYAAETDPLFVLLLFLAPGLAWADKTDDYIIVLMNLDDVDTDSIRHGVVAVYLPPPARARYIRSSFVDLRSSFFVLRSSFSVLSS
jgi:hypothetical protein